jgi:elongation factor 2
MNFLRQYVGDVELTASSPIAAYRETVSKQGRTVMAKSPNKANEFWVEVEPLKGKFLKLREKSRLSERTMGEKTADLQWEELESIWAVDKNENVLMNLTEDSQYLQDAKSSIITGFHWACRTGALCEEPLREVKVKLIKTQLDPDPELREPAQTTRAVSRAILGSFLTAKPIILEPIYKIEVSVQAQWFGTCTSIISRRRGKILSTAQKGLLTTITGYIPVAETFGLSAEMRSATSGYAFWQFAFDHWHKIPEKLASEVIKKLRERRGLPEEIPTAQTFVDKA